jgi:hypothetical protein
MALALALFALVIIGALVASNFFAALLEQQSGRNLLVVAGAGEAAEGKLWESISTLPPAGLLGLAVGGVPETLEPPLQRPDLLLESQVARLADNLFLVQARAVREDGAGGQSAGRSVGILARLVPDGASGEKILQPISRRAWVQLY